MTRRGVHPRLFVGSKAQALILVSRNGTVATSQALRHLDADERRVVKRVVLRSEYPVLFTGFRGSELTLVSRPGLFKLIQRSNKPEAKERIPGCTLAAPHNLEICGKHSISPVRRVISIARPIPDMVFLRGVQHGSTLIWPGLDRELKRHP